MQQGKFTTATTTSYFKINKCTPKTRHTHAARYY